MRLGEGDTIRGSRGRRGSGWRGEEMMMLSD